MNPIAEKVGERDTRYPRITLEEVVQRAPQRVLLPDGPHDFTMNVGQAIVASLKAIRQPLMVDSQQMQQRGLQIMNVDTVFDGVVTQIIGLADRHAPLHASAGYPHGEGFFVMVAARFAIGVTL